MNAAFKQVVSGLFHTWRFQFPCINVDQATLDEFVVEACMDVTGSSIRSAWAKSGLSPFSLRLSVHDSGLSSTVSSHSTAVPELATQGALGQQVWAVITEKVVKPAQEVSRLLEGRAKQRKMTPGDFLTTTGAHASDAMIKACMKNRDQKVKRRASGP